MKSKLKMASFAMCALFSQVAFGLQEITVRNQDKVDVVISNSDVNRVAFTNDQIKHVYGALSVVHVDLDNDNGQIFLLPKAKKMKPFTLSLISASGATIDLRVTSQKKESETILLSLDKRGKDELSKEKKAQERTIRRIMTVALKGKTLKGYRVLEHEDSHVDRPHKSLIQKKTYLGSKYKMMVFDYTNLKPKGETITESTFKISPNSIAVAIANKTLKPKETTKVVVLEDIQQQIKHLKR